MTYRRDNGNDAGDSRLRAVFFGTASFSASVLSELAGQRGDGPIDVVCAYTRPDAARGRGKRPRPSEVKQLAEELGIPVMQPARPGADDAGLIAGLGADVAVVAAYGAIIPPELLGAPRLGFVNVHASALPRWRGAAPVERAILAGDSEIGCSLMRVREGLDTGEFVPLRSIAAGGKGTAEILAEMADGIGAEIASALADLDAGLLGWLEQDGARATYAEKIGKGELALDPSETAVAAERKVRASGPSRAARAEVCGRAVRVVSARSVGACGAGTGPLPSEGVAAWSGGRLLLGTREGALEVLSVKPDGKREMGAAAFAAGMPQLRAGGRWRAVNVI